MLRILNCAQRWFAVSALVFLVVGCETSPRANYERLNLVNAQGTVTLDGEPLAGAVITFDDPADETFSYGLTDASGHYRLQLDSVMPGVKAGPKVVRISTRRRIQGLNTSEEGGDPDAEPQPEQVPEQYNRKSTLQVEVTSGKTTYDFALKSK